MEMIIKRIVKVCININECLSGDAKKPVMWGLDQVQNNLGCIVTEEGWKLQTEIL